MYVANMFINGQRVDKTEADRFDVINPATGDVLGDVPSAGPSDVEAALAAAQSGFEAWRSKRRGNALRSSAGSAHCCVSALRRSLSC